jgi:transposase InsO family protein
VTTGGCYAWLGRAESAHAQQDRRLSKEIARLFLLHRARYGSPRIHHALKTLGWHVSRRRVAQLMRRAGLRAKAVHGYRAKAKIHRLYARHPNRLWEATVTGPNQVWVGDITFFKVGQRLALSRDRHGSAHAAYSCLEPHAPSHGHGDECCLGRRRQGASRTWGDRSQ